MSRFGCIVWVAFSIVRATAAPLGDFRNDPIFILGHSGTNQVSNAEATADPLDPPELTGGRTIWFGYFAPMNGVVTFETTGSSFDTMLLAWLSYGATNPIANVFNDNIDETNRQGRIHFNVKAARYYFVAVDGASGATGEINLSWNLQLNGELPDLTIQPTPPGITYENSAGQECSSCPVGPGLRRLLRFGARTRNQGNADLYLRGLKELLPIEYHPCHQHYHLLGYADYTVLDTNHAVVAASRKISFCLEDSNRWDEQAPSDRKFFCFFQGIQMGWEDLYRSSLPCQWIDITDLAPGQYFLELEVDPGNQIPELDDANNVTRLPISIPGGTGTFVNDTWLSAHQLSGVRGEFSGRNPGAGREPGEPVLGSGHTVWYRWTAPSNGLVTFDVLGRSPYLTIIPAFVNAFVGDAVERLTSVASNAVPSATTTFYAVEGQEYWVQVDSATEQTGEFMLHLWLGPTPNDHFADAWNAEIGFNGYRLSTVHATREPGEPLHAGNPGGHSVWFSWQPVISREISISLFAADFDPVLAIYTGNALSNLVLVASNDEPGYPLSSTVEMVTEAGTQYWIAVDGADGVFGRFDLSMDYARISPQFAEITVTNHQLRITLEADRGYTFAIETSSNLLHWTQSQRVETDEGRVEFYDTVVPNGPHRFYRARQIPDND